MKLTLEIPNEHAAEVVRLLAKLMRTEEPQDVAEGHPELPLDVKYGFDIPKFPPIPEKYDRWFYLGKFDHIDPIEAPHCGNREIMFYDDDTWNKTCTLSGPFHHIEALRSNDNDFDSHDESIYNY